MQNKLLSIIHNACNFENVTPSVSKYVTLNEVIGHALRNTGC